MNAPHPLFAEILRMHGAPSPMTEAELVKHREAIDAAMLADKLVDGYGQRNQARAQRLQEQSNPGAWL